MKNIIVITVKLLVITIVAAVLLGVVNSVTKEPIALQEEKAANEARNSAFPTADEFVENDIEIPEEFAIVQNVYIAKKDGNDIGAVIGLETKGFNAGLNMTVGVSSNGAITGVVIGTHTETPGLGAKASDAEFIGQFKDVPFDKALIVVKTPPTEENEIEAITSATITSVAVTDAVNTAVAFYKEIGGSK